MGFAKVIIIGMDHRFSAVGTPNASEIRSAEKKTMITSTQTIFPKGIKWQLPDLYRSELAYREARTMFEKKTDAALSTRQSMERATCSKKMPLEKALSA
ncbi:hypothetical protein ACFSTD_24190 [Novosphingobium colocasiae]